MKTFARILPVLVAWTVAAPALAQDEFAAGREEYLAACAACHGEAADGNGPIASMFSVPVPDLRKIAARNDGVFPVFEVFQVVDGRTEVRAHGDPMPIFGRRYEVQAEEITGRYGAETMARTRMLELVYYLQSIQE